MHIGTAMTKEAGIFCFAGSLEKTQNFHEKTLQFLASTNSTSSTTNYHKACLPSFVLAHFEIWPHLHFLQTQVSSQMSDTTLVLYLFAYSFTSVIRSMCTSFEVPIITFAFVFTILRRKMHTHKTLPQPAWASEDWGHSPCKYLSRDHRGLATYSATRRGQAPA